MKLRELGEDRLIARLVRRLKSRRDVVIGPGDDCAVVENAGEDYFLLLKTDCVVEGVHFLPNESPFAVGRKAMARVLSDFAAMSGLPRFALVTLIVRRDQTAAWTRRLYRGLQSAADRFDVVIVGGETSSTSAAAVVSVSAIGVVEKNRVVSRDGGKANDFLYVTGKLGGSLRKKHLDFKPRIEESRWLTSHFQIHAMMDLSDGLGADLPRLARASGFDFEIDTSALLRNRGCAIDAAINDGEDYELLFALSPNDSAALEKSWRKKFPRLPLTRIGRLVRLTKSKKRQSFHGYDHFA
jgi:thiamine-monophosphate kinase